MTLEELYKEVEKHPEIKNGLELLKEKAKKLGIGSLYEELSYNDQLSLVEELECFDFSELEEGFRLKHLSAEKSTRLEKNMQRIKYDKSL